MAPANLLASPVLWWAVLAAALSALYLAVYVLLRTSADDRPWYRRLTSPSASTGAVDGDATPHPPPGPPPGAPPSQDGDGR